MDLSWLCGKPFVALLDGDGLSTQQGLRYAPAARMALHPFVEAVNGSGQGEAAGTGPPAKAGNPYPPDKDVAVLVEGAAGGLAICAHCFGSGDDHRACHIPAQRVSHIACNLGGSQTTHDAIGESFADGLPSHSRQLVE